MKLTNFSFFYLINFKFKFGLGSIFNFEPEAHFGIMYKPPPIPPPPP